MADQPDARALRRLAIELAEEPTPELDWGQIEARLMRGLELEQSLAHEPLGPGEQVNELLVAGPPDAANPERGTAARMTADETARFLASIDDESESVERESLVEGIERESILPAASLAPVPAVQSRDSVPAPRPATGAAGRARRSALAGTGDVGTGDHLALAKAVDPARGSFRRTLVLVALAAAVLLGIGVARLRGGATDVPPIAAERWIDPDTVPMADGLPGVRSIDALRAGDVVEAAAGSLSFGRSGLVMNLAAGSRVKVVSEANGQRLFVLDHGSLETTLTEGASASGSTPLLIGAGETRIATTGASTFVVTRSSRGLVVEVELGEIAVSGLEGTPTQTLRAPAKASVSLDGAKEVRPVVSEPRAPEPPVALSPTGTVAPEGPPAKMADRSVPRAPEPTTPSTPSAEPTATPATPASERTVSEATLRGQLDGCFRGVQAARRELASKSGSVNDEVKVAIRSTLELRVGSSGLVESGKFSPPLRADLQACAVPVMRANVGGSARTIRIPVDIAE